MPWLYFSLAPKHLTWAKLWQHQLQSELCSLEAVSLAENCFISPQANIFAEPGRTVAVGAGSYIAAYSYIHGPVTLGSNVSINHNCSLDGSRAGIHIGDNTRIAANCHLFAFNHGMKPDTPIASQAVTSVGIYIGSDVWIGANSAIVDGVTIADHAVVGINSTVTKNVAPYAIVAGNPAIKIGDRRDKK